LRSGPACHEHYRGVLSKADETFVQCPFGFTTLITRAGASRFALTGVVAHPRFHTANETKVGKQYPENRTTRKALLTVSDALKSVAAKLHALESGTIQQYSMALHEIRKLNRQVKQTAERMCLRESPKNPDEAAPDLVKILKTSELMTRQFDVIEILANEDLTRLPANQTAEVYKIFDKCARIYRTESQKITIEAPFNFHPKVAACDKTFPIIPSVLIENALKYSIPHSEIRIAFRPWGAGSVMVSVSNLAVLKVALGNAVFDRGYRAASDKEGSGNGLYVAQLVARQHGSKIQLEVAEAGNGQQRVTFAVHFPAKY